MLMRVITVDLETAKREEETVCNIFRAQSVHWLIGHLKYCYKHNKGVQMLSVKAREPE